MNVENGDSDNEMDIVALDEEDGPTMAILIGYNVEKGCEEQYTVNFEALKKYSKFVAAAVKSDEGHNKIFKVKSGESASFSEEKSLRKLRTQKEGTQKEGDEAQSETVKLGNPISTSEKREDDTKPAKQASVRQERNEEKGSELASHIVVKFMAEWINHYSGPGSINPRIIAKPIKPRDLPSLIKLCFKNCSIEEKKKEYEGKWWEQFIVTLAKIKGATFGMIRAANYMDMTNINIVTKSTTMSDGTKQEVAQTEEYGGLLNMMTASLAHYIKGEPKGVYTKTLDAL